MELDVTNQNHFQFLECIIRKHLKFESVHKLDANEKKNLHIKFMMKIQVSSLHSKQKKKCPRCRHVQRKILCKIFKRKKKESVCDTEGFMSMQTHMLHRLIDVCCVVYLQIHFQCAFMSFVFVIPILK